MSLSDERLLLNLEAIETKLSRRLIFGNREEIDTAKTAFELLWENKQLREIASKIDGILQRHRCDDCWRLKSVSEETGMAVYECWVCGLEKTQRRAGV